ncbi:23S rRNA pseudouridine1911/1915/1917 synthase [Sporomusaceae bacterium BoRhaA]|uniref:RluA family pseudouridine synthase n=1 Tax=Pelorhabdus rhamnosifermentans TaxID=2772457 RepID=UPI001C061D3A|nr:RluA family pseudouridine synthase [Pelorhabdus rhamnosifermentans]MBU2703468.1 23S rRNA pseudouridine1911/1915/1917 synthase [Pelorhabdus rhamnosifermentans]
MLTFHVNYNTNQGLLTIQQYARQKLKMSLTAWRKFKHTGSIQRNGQLALPCDFIHSGDTLSFDSTITNHIEPAYEPLDIAYEDDTLLIINKAPGLLVHPTSNQQELTLANYIMGHYARRNEFHNFHPVHRLDRNTSGLILIAKVPYIQQQLSEKSISGITRNYLALVHGKLLNQGFIHAPIGRKPGSIIERIVTNEGQEALTEYTTLESFENATLIQVKLLTGRTHQIRVHMAYIGHPLLGDDLYGGTRNLINRQALHSSMLNFIHPMSKNEMCILSPLPNDMLQTLNKLRGNKK